MTSFNFLYLQHMPIFEQLQIEEALLRLSSDNWCIVNEGSQRSIVMGISGKEHELIDIEKVKNANIPLIRRFSGGGTVIVDSSTLFATFICQKNIHAFEPFPEPILRWTAEFYQKAFKLPHFSLKEQDYTLDHLKCAGNAQYLKKDRWLHHTTFLWDFSDENMEFLLMPKKRPKYRENRSHLDFLCKLKPFFPSLTSTKEAILHELKCRYTVKETTLDQIKELLEIPHRKTTQFISL